MASTCRWRGGRGMLSSAMVGLRAFRLLPLWLLLAAGQHAPPDPPPADPPRPVRPPTIAVGEASIDDTLEIGGEDIAALQLETRMAVDVSIDGRGPYRFVVDSGADRSVIGARLAATLGLPPGPSVTLHGMAGASRRDTVRIARLAVGRSVVEDVAAPVLPEQDLGARGLLGIDALRGQRLRLDYEARTIAIEDTRVPVRTSGDEIVVTARRRGGQLILTQARAGGVGIRAVVDTGSQLTIGNLALRDALFRRRKPPAEHPVTFISVTGEAVTIPAATVAELRIGGIVMRDVDVAFADLPPFALFGLQDKPAMMLGSDLMGSFRRVSLDFGAKKVRFQLYRCRPTARRAGPAMREEAWGGDADCSAPRRGR